MRTDVGRANSNRAGFLDQQAGDSAPSHQRTNYRHTIKISRIAKTCLIVHRRKRLRCQLSATSVVVP